jgi:class 3 adenylate cyclase/tetratricopeptide (TPR) repeat protein
LLIAIPRDDQKMNIGDWLRGLDLGRYEQAFRDNEIDEQILPSLTVEDLKEIGVGPVGHRRKLLEAIAALSLGKSQPLVLESAPALPSEPHSSPERRQLTVMFCDLVGSTALSSRLDPEDLREVIAAYRTAVAEEVGRFDGFIAKYMGDGVLIYFGYPQAHEDDAERSVRAGLALAERVGGLDTLVKLESRIGIATGVVIVGDLIGSGEAQERGVVGETPNLAARLQGLAAPNAVVISEATRRQIGGLYEVENLGPQPLVGFVEPQGAWRVIGESGQVSRFEALRSRAAPLIGRDEELELLLRHWGQVKAGEGQAVLISGEPGIGKSRLTAAISECLDAEEHTRLRYFCSPHHQDSALYPFIAQLERAAGFARGDTPGLKLHKLLALLATGTPDEDDTALLAELLSLPNTAAGLNLSPQRRREKLFEALLAQFAAVARAHPVLMVFEDAHWIDPTSRELMNLTIESVRHLPVLLIVTFRPEFQHEWGGRPHVIGLALNRLDERDVAALVIGLAGNAPLGSGVVREIAARTDGVPLFVEELTKAVLERAQQDDRVAAVLSAIPSPASPVPATLQASLMARLDRIGAAAKEVAQIAAVLGREFNYELIERVAQRPDLDAALVRLAEASLVFCRGMPPNSSYLFKHALVQDAAYDTLLRSRRQELHARVAAVLEQHFSDLVERQPELLAHHLTAARESGRAVEQWLKAGRHAAGRLAHVEAISHLELGLALVRSLPETSARDACETEIQLALGVSSITVRGMGSSAVAEAYGRARELAERREDQRQLFEATYGIWQNLSGSGRTAAAHPWSAQLMQLAERGADDGLRLQAHHSAWTTLYLGGVPRGAHEHCEAGRRLYDPQRHQSHRNIYGGHDPGVCARMTAGQVDWLLGYPDRAVVSTEQALRLADEIAHPFTREIALQYAAFVRLARGEPELGLAHERIAEALRVEQRVAFVIDPLFFRGAVQVAEGRSADAVVGMRESFKPGRPGTLWRPYAKFVFAHALTEQGRHDEALAALAEGCEWIEATGERVWEAELHRMKGLVLLAQDRLGEAQTSLQQAVRIARHQQAKSLELRASVNLARIWAEDRRRAEARDLLEPVYCWFTEGFDTADLRQAKALLDELT